MIEKIKLFLNENKNKILNLRGFDLYLRILFIFLFFLSLYGIYKGFLRALIYLKNVPIFGEYLTFKLLSLTLFASMILLPLSGIINSFNIMFEKNEIEFLFSLPYKNISIFYIKFFESIFHTIWMLFLIFIPVIIAYA
ncbi:MAG: hypothetical protein DRI36_06495, partial [Caldiserica bacterium]